MKKKTLIKAGPKGSAKHDKKPASKAPASKGASAKKTAVKAFAKKKPAKVPQAKPAKAKKIHVAPGVKGKRAAPPVAAKKPVKIEKSEKPLKGRKEKDLKDAKAPLVAKATPAAAAEKGPKKESKAAAKKGRPAPAKKNEEEIEDDFIADDDLGNDDIGEYEEELKAVETLDDEAEEVVEWTQDGKEKGDEEIYLTDAEGRRYCRARDCDQAAVVDTYCRYHYLLFWRKIQVRKRILLDGKLEHYIEELTARYPDKFLEMIRRDLRTEKDFLGAIQELEIDEAGLDNEMEEDTQSYIEEVRGIGEGSGSGVEDEEF